MKLAFFLLFLSIEIGPHSNLESLISNVVTPSRKVASVPRLNICDNFNNVSNSRQFKVAIGKSVEDQHAAIGNIDDRHSLGNILNECDPNENSKALILSFAGTGSYNPRAFHLMRQLISCESVMNLPRRIKRRSYNLALQGLGKLNLEYSKWSAIEAGPLGQFIQDLEINRNLDNVSFATFASEEIEILAGPERFTPDWMLHFANSLTESQETILRPTGVIQAVNCAYKYFNSARALNINPKLIILTHSSGGRAAVKFLEAFKHIYNKNADLVFTIDPVKEAQLAIVEILSQIQESASQEIFNRIAFWTDSERVRLPNIWTRMQPHRLYKTSNVKKWVNVYQSQDTEGFSCPVQFGIHGSPIYRADANHHIQDSLGGSAHGAIATNQRVQGFLKENLLDILQE